MLLYNSLSPLPLILVFQAKKFQPGCSSAKRNSFFWLRHGDHMKKWLCIDLQTKKFKESMKS